jgi:hypothetical protein
MTFRTNKKTNSVDLVRKQTMPTERQPLVGEVSDRLCGLVPRVPRDPEDPGLIPGATRFSEK